MALHTWLAYVAAFTVLTLIPGPSVLLVTGQAIAHGLRSAFLCIVGNSIGVLLMASLTLAGVGAILAASSALFEALRWAGVAYMAYLGVRQIMAARRGALRTQRGAGTGAVLANLRAGLLAAILNPKSIAFYTAFLTQFIDPTGDALAQSSILVATSAVISTTILALLAVVAAIARRGFAGSTAERAFGYGGGACMLGGSLLLAANR